MNLKAETFQKGFVNGVKVACYYKGEDLLDTLCPWQVCFDSLKQWISVLENKTKK